LLPGCIPLQKNAILALPNAGFSDNVIFAAYQQQYNLFTLKGYNIRLNVMDNQATKVINKILDKQQCDLLLVKSYNHCVDTVKPAIQTFKAISSAPSPQLTASFLCLLHVNPNISAYDWNRFSLAPLGCKAVV
jgi:hypothetical protein